MQKQEGFVGSRLAGRWMGAGKDRVVGMARPAVAVAFLAIGLQSVAAVASAETLQLAQSTITSTPLTPPQTAPAPAPVPAPAPTVSPTRTVTPTPTVTPAPSVTPAPAVTPAPTVTAPAVNPTPAPVTTTTTTLPTTAGAALSVTELRECLCMDQQMAAMREDLMLRQDLLNERQQELANLDQQVKTQATALAPGDAVGHRVLQDLLAQQQAVRNSIQSTLRPGYNNLANQWNAIVARYNGQCVNRPRYAIDVNAAQQNLQCPKGY